MRELVALLSDYKDQLHIAFDTALAQYQEVMGQPVSAAPQFEAVDDSVFWAYVEEIAGGYEMQVSTGVVKMTAELWDAAFAGKEFIAGIGHSVMSNDANMTHISLVWLMLHELHHIDLNHFDLSDSFRIAETNNAPQFNLVRRVEAKPDLLATLPKDIRDHAPLCLELQADHDAAEMLIDAYSAEEWQSLRHRAMAISGMMMLIERENSQSDDGVKTHPMAATRVFQLLGHVAELPLIPAQAQARINGVTEINPDDLPPLKEQRAYGREVTLPCFFDAVHLARISGAENIQRDLGEPQDFFADIAIAKTGDPARFGDLTTKGAKEWADLVSTNEALKQFQTLPDGLGPVLARPDRQSARQYAQPRPARPGKEPLSAPPALPLWHVASQSRACRSSPFFQHTLSYPHITDTGPKHHRIPC